MSFHGFSDDYAPVPRRGLTPVEAIEFMRAEFPSLPQWTLWAPPYLTARLLTMMVGKGHQAGGEIGGWTWVRVPCSYPDLALWDGHSIDPGRSDDWVGVLKVSAPSGESFHLFSFMNSKGVIGEWYLASTYDVRVLDLFAQAVRGHFHRPGRVTIEVHGGSNVVLNATDDETIFLPERLREDIERQVYSFFENGDEYRRLGLRYRRGFLLVGPPGNGKTLLLRHLVRQCDRRRHVAAHMLAIGRRTEDGDVTLLFRDAVRKAPSLVILEDLDSLTKESHVARAHLLGQLDGLDSKEGVLVIGTTNNPEQIDPALAHRPSRFDRVWHFPPPDREMRGRYLQWAFPGVDASAIPTIADQTADWSFAYLNELRTTAAILAIGHGAPAPCQDDLSAALGLLLPQFRAGKHNHAVAATTETTGFCSA